MIERHYGRVLDGAGASITARLDRFHAEQERRPSRPRSAPRVASPRPEVARPARPQRLGARLVERWVLRGGHEAGATGLEPATSGVTGRAGRYDAFRPGL